LGAEEYELLVSTLNKLPILKENLSSKREQLGIAERSFYGLKAEINDLQKDLNTRDSEVEKIDSEIEKIDSQLEKVKPEMVDLEDNIKAEEEKVKPYSLRLEKANKRLSAAQESGWLHDYRFFLVIFGGPWLLFIPLALLFREPEAGAVMLGGICLGPFVLASLGEWIKIRNENVAIGNLAEVRSELKKARGALDGFQMKRGKKEKKKASLVIKESKLKSKKGRLIGLDEKLKKMNKQLDDLVISVSAYSKAVESLEKEIEDGQNAIAPLIPYSDLLLGDE
jgi:chromosome segregation ATPase